MELCHGVVAIWGSGMHGECSGGRGWTQGSDQTRHLVQRRVLYRRRSPWHSSWLLGSGGVAKHDWLGWESGRVYPPSCCTTQQSDRCGVFGSDQVPFIPILSRFVTMGLCLGSSFALIDLFDDVLVFSCTDRKSESRFPNVVECEILQSFLDVINLK